MLPLSDGIPTRRVPIVNLSIIAANFAVWLFYELPHLQRSVIHASFYPCSVDGSCHELRPETAPRHHAAAEISCCHRFHSTDSCRTLTIGRVICTPGGPSTKEGGER